MIRRECEAIPQMQSLIPLRDEHFFYSDINSEVLSVSYRKGRYPLEYAIWELILVHVML